MLALCWHCSVAANWTYDRQTLLHLRNALVTHTLLFPTPDVTLRLYTPTWCVSFGYPAVSLSGRSVGGAEANAEESFGYPAVSLSGRTVRGAEGKRGGVRVAIRKRACVSPAQPWPFHLSAAHLGRKDLFLARRSWDPMYSCHVSITPHRPQTPVSSARPRLRTNFNSQLYLPLKSRDSIQSLLVCLEDIRNWMANNFLQLNAIQIQRGNEAVMRRKSVTRRQKTLLGGATTKKHQDIEKYPPLLCPFTGGGRGTFSDLFGQRAQVKRTLPAHGCPLTGGDASPGSSWVFVETRRPGERNGCRFSCDIHRPGTRTTRVHVNVSGAPPISVRLIVNVNIQETETSIRGKTKRHNEFKRSVAIRHWRPNTNLS
ncbi:unnamed protein product [Pleuronectes platessa]|uniref:Uncharacterized protein n=1 Tax=Pleuronectes platessa TaxID=8262 RepID=A0A9N7TSG3_PLEPL|nr:unnamed protein product [Pleuronectes platessa]